jgi:signal peptidase I
MNIDEITQELEEARDEYSKAFKNLPMDENYSFKQMEEDLKPYTDKVSKLSKLYRLHCPINEYREIPTYGDVISIDDFIGYCKSGWFIDYDGYGNYCTEDKMTDIVILPSDIKAGMYRKDFKKIIWFNR